MDSKISRRKFVVTTVAAGFALAVRPISAWAITTDPEGLEVGDIQIPVGSENIPAYWAMPKGKTGLPVLIVCHEIFGVHEHIRDVCRRLAKMGFLAIAPNLYSRQGDVTQIKDIKEILSKVVSKVPAAQVMSDLDATVAYLGKTTKADPRRVGLVGFCWGGRTVWLYCAHNPKIKAGAAFYGPLAGANPLWPQTATEIAPTLTVPVIGFYGGKDDHITADQITLMRGGLKTGSSHSEIVVYPDAPHGFFADYRDSYREKDAQDALQKMSNWFKKHGLTTAATGRVSAQKS